MEEMNNTKHVMVTELDGATDALLSFTVDSKDLLLDAKFLMCEYYVATINEEGNSLKIAFNNGQKFKLSVEEYA